MILYTAAYYPDPKSGWYSASVLDFPGVLSQGKNLEHARRMLGDALRDMTEWYLEDGLALPKPQPGISDPEAAVLEPIELVIRARPGVKAR